jgi:hypothetical protein
VSAFVAPIPEPPLGSFGRCECAHAIYDHGRINMDGNQVWAGCKIAGCDCTSFRAVDGSAWPNSYGGATVAGPDDLDRNTDAWVDRQVVLEHEREPDVGDAA